MGEEMESDSDWLTADNGREFKECVKRVIDIAHYHPSLKVQALAFELLRNVYDVDSPGEEDSSDPKSSNVYFSGLHDLCEEE